MPPVICCVKVLLRISRNYHLTSRQNRGIIILLYIEKGTLTMDEKKRNKMIKVFRVVALVVAVIMIISIIVQSFVF